MKLLGAALYAAGAAATWALARELDLAPALAARSGAPLPAHRCAGVVGALGHGGRPLRGAHRRRHRGPPAGAARRSSPAVRRWRWRCSGSPAWRDPRACCSWCSRSADRLLFPRPGPSGAERWRGLAIGALCAALAIAAFQLFSLTVSGSPLPTTYAVKTDGPRSLLPSGLYLLRVVGVLFRPHPLPVLLAAGGALCLLERLRTPRDRGLLPALWVAGLPLAYSLYDSPDAPMMVGNFGRYYFPLDPVRAGARRARARAAARPPARGTRTLARRRGDGARRWPSWCRRCRAWRWGASATPPTCATSTTATSRCRSGSATTCRPPR